MASRIDAKIEAVRQRQTEIERGRARRPPLPEWTVELGIGAGRPPVQVHAGDCYTAGKRRRPVDRDEARRLLADGLRLCTHCRPDTRLNVIDLSDGPTAAPRPTPPEGHRRCTPLPHHRSPNPTRPPRLPGQPGRTLRRLPAKDPQVRPRRHAAVPWCATPVLKQWGPHVHHLSTHP
ncbi:DUF6233 domain-containing protein [Streptomyces rishiriensis]|uniref:DUF6233 domain-containing protein n=1 Tax=Streptomyces rishiriensis TaxID=68264 RepID=UPI0027D99265|nr:DUF6233 domain-containing protein [Streptomyces rishiriensis]